VHAVSVVFERMSPHHPVRTIDVRRSPTDRPGRVSSWAGLSKGRRRDARRPARGRRRSPGLPRRVPA
jgi:hypothetical protein